MLRINSYEEAAAIITLQHYSRAHPPVSSAQGEGMNSILGVPTNVIGLVEGLAEAAASIWKLIYEPQPQNPSQDLHILAISSFSFPRYIY